MCGLWVCGVQAIEAAKEESLRQHQKMQIAMKKQRAFIVESMEMAKRKKDWGKAREIVNMALTQVGRRGVAGEGGGVGGKGWCVAHPDVHDDVDRGDHDHYGG